MAEQQCAHEGCECEMEQGKGVSRGGQFFCSDHCANAGASVSENCDCGHDDCR